jgi:hypothetical protein
MRWWTKLRLRRRLRSSSIDEAAIAEIRRIGDDDAVGLLVTFIETSSSRSYSHDLAIAALANTPGDAAADAVLRVLETRREGVADKVLKTVIERVAQRADQRAVEALMRFIDDQEVSDDQKTAAIRALGSIGSDAAVHGLSRLIDTRRSDLGLVAVDVLGSVGTRAAPAVDLLLQSLDDGAAATDPIHRIMNRKYSDAVTLALGRIGDAKAVPALIQQLGQASSAAAVALDQVDPAWRSRPEVAAARKRLLNSLPNEGPVAGSALDLIDDQWRTSEEARAVFAQIRKALPSHLSGRRPELANEIWVAGELGDSQDTRLIELLAQAQNSGDVFAQRFATMALERLTPDYIARDAERVVHLLDAFESSTDRQEQARAFEKLERLFDTEFDKPRHFKDSPKREALLSKLRLRELRRLKVMSSIPYSFEATRDDEPVTIATRTDPTWMRSFAEQEIRLRA